MDPWTPLPDPRAYTAAPMAPAVGVFHAVAWVFSHGAGLTWASLEIVVPGRDLLPEIEQLGRLESRGVRMGTIAQAESTRHLDRVVIAYRPDAGTLARAERLADARVVVAVGDDPGPLRHWVNEHRPGHLGGGSLLASPPAPLPDPATAV